MQASIPNHVDTDDDAAIMRIVHENPEWKVEVSADRRILFSPLTGTRSGPKEGAAYAQLLAYAERVGGKAYSASTGFRLADGSVLGPDAAWVSAQRLAALRDSDRESAFWRLCPDVAVEVMSEWDMWSTLLRKLDRYIANGVRYAVAIDCERRVVKTCGSPPDGLCFDFERIFDA